MTSTKLTAPSITLGSLFERYVNFDFYKTACLGFSAAAAFERYVNFDFYKTLNTKPSARPLFERYVNFDFYKTCTIPFIDYPRLRDM